MQAKLRQGQRHPWIFDGRKIAWSLNNVNEMRTQVNMDEERGRAPRPGKAPDVVYLMMKKTNVIRMDALRAYLAGQMGWDEHVLECMNFLDHVLRQNPSEELLSIKRNFYAKTNAPRELLDRTNRHIEAVKGIYASIRTNSSMRSGGTGLGVNVDVANTAFWRGGMTLLELATGYLRSCKREWANLQPAQFVQNLKPVPIRGRDGNVQPGMSDMFMSLRRMSKLEFHIKHRGKVNDDKVYKIKNFVWDPKRFGRDGANARNYKFEKDGQDITIEKYFAERYDIKLKAWEMPLVETTRAGVFPMEVITIDPYQRYNWKLDGDQTSAMIKFAVTRPDKRRSDIMDNVKTLRWTQDPYLKDFGIQIKSEMESIQARIIANPVLQFGKKQENPMTKGRWDLRGHVFAAKNKRPLKSWGIVVINNCVQMPAVQAFVQNFVNIYRGHGGQIVTPQPGIHHLQMARNDKPAAELEEIYQKIGNTYKATPDLVWFILPSKDTITYERIKKNMEIRFATLTQMVLASHVQKNAPQYCSNVAMKVNAKLGGYTNKLALRTPFFTEPTMCIGVDVSHGSHGQAGPGAPGMPSMAAMTMSMDRDGVAYASSCQTNGYRVEVLSKSLINKIFPDMVKRWCQSNGTAPSHVFYFRDGCSEGEFHHVLEQEIDEVRKVIEGIKGGKVKITVIVATKRHHIRFFPGRSGDRNANPLPGTVVEHEVTHPYHYDFYLCSHVAIQGTARPVHYHVLMDEIQYPVDKLQTMIYQQCYQYVRSTTPVSIHPAIYYAHLAAARARAHEDSDISDKDLQLKAEEMRMPLAKHDDLASIKSGQLRDQPAPDLLQIGSAGGKARPENITFFNSTMWFV